MNQRGRVQPGKVVVGHCGKDGRVARANIRSALDQGTIADSWPRRHIEGCGTCRARIQQAITKNFKRTTYLPTVRETLAEVKPKPSRFGRERRSSW